MMKITMSVVMSLTISVMIMMMCYFISTNRHNDRENMSPFECGFNPLSSARLPFSIQFFLIAVLFLIFDIEIAIILPIILTMKWSITSTWIITIMMFITILILGLWHEWNSGMLEWAK
uniref:NADH-ubiquinone oxidoreductase chain 3 n=1 Tax=Geotomus sp. FS-2019 TaxID=2575688 RepID=A0A4D6X3Q5_9HEMI|nr:NADH dehydrogenase subunit 3 [Geotomus sp. FS-2019]